MEILGLYKPGHFGREGQKMKFALGW